MTDPRTFVSSRAHAVPLPPGFTRAARRPAPNPSPQEQAVIDRFGIFEEEGNGRRLAWFTTAELEAEVRRRAADAPSSAIREERDRELVARHLRSAASAVNVTDWPAYLRDVADGHADGSSWFAS